MLDLPLPDSPTSASVVPAGTRRSTLHAASCLLAEFIRRAMLAGHR
jgi:hypothetical protein